MSDAERQALMRTVQSTGRIVRRLTAKDAETEDQDASAEQNASRIGSANGESTLNPRR